jgi:ribosome biogenesis protein ERB1
MQRCVVVSHEMYLDSLANKSYRPPDEFLLNEEEKKKWEEADPDERETDFLPKKHDALRHVASYDEAVRERFHRCLDL